jgi:hypothetical protein
VLLELDYYKENEDEFSVRRVEPYALINGREGWYVATFDPAKQDVRHFRLDRIKRAELTSERFEPRARGQPVGRCRRLAAHGRGRASRSARVWISPERARWAREQRKIVAEYDDGAIAVELSFAGLDWLVREVLKEAGDAAVLEPPTRAPQCWRSQADAMSRRDEIRMTELEVTGLLEQQHTVICATTGADGWPHVVPLWYVVRDGEIWVWTYAASQKVANLERDPYATLLVEAGDVYAELRGVMLKVEAEIERDPELVSALGLAVLERNARGGEITREAAEVVVRQASKRVAIRFVEHARISWDHRKLAEI